MSVTDTMNISEYAHQHLLYRRRSSYEKTVEKERRSIRKGVIRNEKKRKRLEMDLKKCNEESEELEKRGSNLEGVHCLRDDLIAAEKHIDRIGEDKVNGLRSWVSGAAEHFVAAQNHHSEKQRVAKRSKISQEAASVKKRDLLPKETQCNSQEDYTEEVTSVQTSKEKLLQSQRRVIDEERGQLKIDKEALEEKRLRIEAIQDQREDDLLSQLHDLREREELLIMQQERLERDKVDFVRCRA